jgi:hypothetical protein
MTKQTYQINLFKYNLTNLIFFFFFFKQKIYKKNQKNQIYINS